MNWTIDIYVMDTNGDNLFNLSDSPASNQILPVWVPGIGGTSGGATVIEAIFWGRIKQAHSAK
jgi:hypothetical protein